MAVATSDKPEAKEQLLALAFEGRWTQAEMAARVHVSARTIRRWLTSQDFKDRLAALRANLAASLRDVAYADKARRIVALDQMAESARRQYEAKPLLTERRPTPDGDLTNESFNKDAHAAFRESLNDIAKELGERSANVKVTGALEHSLVPRGAARALVDEMLAAVGEMPAARAALAQRLLESGPERESA